MVWSIFTYENDYITTTKEEINGIPCLRFRPKDFKGLLPTVIYYHGWHSSKDFKRFEALIIASHGYQVIVPDALHHGDRQPINHDDPENLDKYLWKIVLQSIKEAKGLIETIINEYEANPEKIGVMGTSMGAITASGVFVDNLNLKFLVGFNGTFAWKEAIKRNDLPVGNHGDEELIEHYDPMSNKNKIKERDILILHGTDDTSLPIESQRFFYNEMLQLYTKGLGNLELIEAANVNHHTTVGMLEKSIIWLKENQ